MEDQLVRLSDALSEFAHTYELLYKQGKKIKSPLLDAMKQTCKELLGLIENAEEG